MTERAAHRPIRELIHEAVRPRLDRWSRFARMPEGGLGHHRIIATYGVPGSGGGGNEHLTLTAAELEEAMRTGDDIDALPAEEAAAVRAYWLEQGTAYSKAQGIECGLAAYYRRLDRGYERLFLQWHG